MQDWNTPDHRIADTDHGTLTVAGNVPLVVADWEVTESAPDSDGRVYVSVCGRLVNGGGSGHVGDPHTEPIEAGRARLMRTEPRGREPITGLDVHVTYYSPGQPYPNNLGPPRLPGHDLLDGPAYRRQWPADRACRSDHVGLVADELRLSGRAVVFSACSRHRPRHNVRRPVSVSSGVMDLPETTNAVDTQDERVRSGPLWRHALWAALVTAAGVTLGWLGALFRIGPEEYGLPPAAPGALWPYLLAWAVIGLGLSAILRFAAAKVPVYSPSEVLLGTVMIGTRLSLGWRPEPSKSRAWPRPRCSW